MPDAVPLDTPEEKQKHKKYIDTKLALYLQDGGMIERIPFGVGSFQYWRTTKSVWKKSQEASV